MLHEWLKDSKHTVVFTGAGMSTESGLRLSFHKPGTLEKERPKQNRKCRCFKSSRRGFYRILSGARSRRQRSWSA